MLIETYQCNNEDATAEARKHKRDFSPTAFLRIIPAGTVMSGNRLPDLPATSPTPENLPRTALSKGSAPSGSHPGYMSHFTDNTRPVGSAASSTERSGRGPYHKGKGADKGTFKGKDKFPSDWPPLNPGPPKGFSKNSPGITPKAPPRVLIKASLMVKVLLHLPYSHLPPTPHLLAVHKDLTSHPFTPHHFTRCQPGHTVRFAVGPLFFSPPFLGFSLSLLYIPFQFVIVFSFSSFPPRFSPLPLIPPFASYAFSSLPFSPTLLRSDLSLPLFVASLGILSGSPPLPFFSSLLCSPFFCPFCPFFFQLPFYPPSILPLLHPFFFASPLIGLHYLSRCLPKVVLPNVAAPFAVSPQVVACRHVGSFSSWRRL